MSPADGELVELAQHVVPGTSWSGARVVRGEFHDVVLLPHRLAVKIARGPAATHLDRRARFLRRLQDLGLPFAVPRPLTDVVPLGPLRAGVATSWVEGTPTPGTAPATQQLRELLEGVAAVPVEQVQDLLDAPHAYAGRDQWAELMLGPVLRLLPEELQDPARRRVLAAIDLPAVDPRLVHGDLAGDNLRWEDDGTLVGVVDWDLAQPFDPAVDAACLAGFGWERVRAVVAPDAYQRALTWFETFGLEQVAAAIDGGAPADQVAAVAGRAARWLSGDLGRSAARRQAARPI